MANTFNLTIVTPNGKKLSDEVSILNCVTTAGAVGILANHIPLVAIIEISHLNYKKPDGNGGVESVDIAIAGGVLSVKDNQAVVLAEAFETKDEIDRQRAEEAKRRAEERLSSNDDNIDTKRAELALKRAMSRLSL
ncbi:MAG: ATP synthase F1 subunit epsilon [Bacilli bacterium]|nr:ATP synthase F1 subunit epsilon [Bacilli bacterium]